MKLLFVASCTALIGALVVVLTLIYPRLTINDTKVLSAQISIPENTNVPSPSNFPGPTLNTTKFPVLSAQGVYAIDLDSGKSLFEKDPDEPLLPASTTKIMTAIVAMDYFKDDDVITVPQLSVEGQKMRLVPFEKITAGSLLKGLLIFSANDAAVTLAYAYPGGMNAFIEAMNAKAKSLYLSNTHFDNPVGLDGANQVTTSRDLVKIASVGIDNPRFAQIVKTKVATVTDVTGNIKHNITNVNKLLGTVEGVEGVKTGWTEAARENLVTYVNRGGKRVMIGLLGSSDRFGETKQLIEWIYESYIWN